MLESIFRTREYMVDIVFMKTLGPTRAGAHENPCTTDVDTFNRVSVGALVFQRDRQAGVLDRLARGAHRNQAHGVGLHALDPRQAIRGIIDLGQG
jgi:hypothetical protein